MSTIDEVTSTTGADLPTAEWPDFPKTSWFQITEQPGFAGEYEVELSTGKTDFIKFGESGWQQTSATVIRWRGQDIRLGAQQRKTLKRTIHEGRHASVKEKAQRAALWLARYYVVCAAMETFHGEQAYREKGNACGWYQLAQRLGVDLTGNTGVAWEADTQALAKFWQELSTDDRERITRIADGFKDGSGDRLSFD
ncbi:hypothetical protein ACLKMY_24840 [Paraburkholderia mimosarum]|uniref:hypothetical protein n=1 Tax=Paraburkholderia mimosarum TaxID=312026 RepID=UPI0039C0F7BB